MAHHQGMSLLSIANATNDGLVQKWFHSHPLVRANELLLQEKLPHMVSSDIPLSDESEESVSQKSDSMLVSRQIASVHASSPRTHVLSNGQFSTMMTHTGGGYVKHKICKSLDGVLIRLKIIGEVFFICAMWKAASFGRRLISQLELSPINMKQFFSVDKYEVRRKQGSIESILEVVVSPEHNAEVRQLRLTNHGNGPRRIEITSYAEVALATQAADTAHPAFQKLFVETEFIPEEATLVARRRPRDSQQSPIYSVHTLAMPGNVQSTQIDYDSSRETFVGRGFSVECPRAMQEKNLSKTTGAVLDPIFSLRTVVEINPSESVILGSRQL